MELVVGKRLNSPKGDSVHQVEEVRFVQQLLSGMRSSGSLVRPQRLPLPGLTMPSEWFFANRGAIVAAFEHPTRWRCGHVTGLGSPARRWDWSTPLVASAAPARTTNDCG